MQLIHVRFQTPSDFRVPGDLSALFRAQAGPGERVDHVSVHPGEDCSLTVGMYVVAGSIVVAERVALTVAQRALSRLPALRGSRITDCAAALVAPYFQALLDAPEAVCDAPGGDGRSMHLPDQDTQER